ncbi:hypothetical protein HY496_00745 [Candidatus Woesearchaeota archaeon]|nr:hypothetical protein [Candidatus Woesearchaeota archaeon]
MMETKKGAIELSANMLVVIIISLVVLAGGITILFQFVSDAEKFEEDLDVRTEAEIQRLLSQEGRQVALPVSKATISRGEHRLFGLGILNTITNPDGNKETFVVLVNPATYLPPQSDPEAAGDPEFGSWVLYNPEPVSLGEQESTSVEILIDVPRTAASGTYLFDVTVQKSDGRPYGPIQKIQVDVK